MENTENIEKHINVSNITNRNINHISNNSVYHKPTRILKAYLFNRKWKRMG